MSSVGITQSSGRGGVLRCVPLINQFRLVLLENVGKVIIPLTIDDYPVLIVSLRFLMSVSFQRLTSQRLIRVFGHGHHPIRRFH